MRCTVPRLLHESSLASPVDKGCLSYETTRGHTCQSCPRRTCDKEARGNAQISFGLVVPKQPGNCRPRSTKAVLRQETVMRLNRVGSWGVRQTEHTRCSGGSATGSVCNTGAVGSARRPAVERAATAIRSDGVAWNEAAPSECACSPLPSAFMRARGVSVCKALGGAATTGFAQPMPTGGVPGCSGRASIIPRKRLSEPGVSAPVKRQRRMFDMSASRGRVNDESLGAPRKVPGLSCGGLLRPVVPGGCAVDDAHSEDECGSPRRSQDISRGMAASATSNDATSPAV